MAAMRKKLGELLVERQAITRAQLQEALNLQRRNGMRLGAALLHLGYLSEAALTEALSQLLRIPAVDLRQVEPEPEAMAAVSARFASEHDLLPYRLHRERGRRVLTVAMSDPMDFRVVDELGFMANARIEPRLASPSGVDQALRKHFGTRFGQTPDLQGPVQLRSDSTSGTMTILRPGGTEEEVHTGARPASPKAASNRRPKAQTFEPAPNPQEAAPVQGVKPKAPMPREDSAILLTEEVSSHSPVAQVEVESLPPRPPPLPGRSAPPAPQDGPGFGALVGATGQTVDADAVMRLERRFWALMRVLAKKGLLTKEEFVRELEDEGWGSS